MSDAVLVLNAGSSSLKFSVFFARGGDEPSLSVRGQLEGIGTTPRFRASDAAGASLVDEALAASDHAAALTHLGAWLRARFSDIGLVGVGHRVVHGGVHYEAPVRVDDLVMSRLETLVPLAPLHQPHNLSAIRAVASALPATPQVACFDTSFHRTQPKVAESFGLPPQYYDMGVRRYGFHGLSYEYIASRLPQVAPELAGGRSIIAHLGNGASMCAVHAGRSVASSMGFTAVDGLPMGTRCGNLDPGVVLFLLRDGMDRDAIEDLLYKRSGLLGMSGLSNDMRRLMASDAPAARFAVDYFVYRISREAGSLAAALGGLDGVVFTAGIGENSIEIRARVVAACAWFGIELDDVANRAGGPRISAPASRVSAWVIPTDEESMIARHTLHLLGAA